MTISPLPAGSGSLYERLAAHIASEISTGSLPVGSRLPTQRALAQDIGTTVGTVGRAYDLLRQQGYVNGTVGRGTYVLEAVSGRRRSMPIRKRPGSEPAWSTIEQRLTEIADHLAAIRSLVERKQD